MRLLVTVFTQLVSIADLTPREHRQEAFVLASPQSVTIEAVGAEPGRDTRHRFGRGDTWWSDDDNYNVWPAAAWIIDARTREVVWDLRTTETERARNGLHSFSGSVRLPAGTYIAHYASYPATSTWSTGNNSLAALLRNLSRRRDVRYGGPYVDDGAYRDFKLVVRGEGRRATDREVADAGRSFAATAIATIRPESGNASERLAFELPRATDVEVFAIGELRRENAFDYAWIQNAETRRRVWEMDYGNTRAAGGSNKNRMARETLHLPAGRYVAYYVTDDSHDPYEWNAVPAWDPDNYGLTLLVADAPARAAVRTVQWEPVPAGQTIVAITGVGDDDLRSEGFALRRAMDVRIYAIGEGSNPDGELDDRAWIVDATSRRRVWTMRYQDTEHAGGAEKNRLFDGTIRLEPGNYMVYFASDGSHSFGHWNSAPPAESRYWGISVFPATGPLDRGAIGPFDNARTGAIAELTRMRDDVRARRSFELDRDQAVRVYAIGEGISGEMYDYGWIEEAQSGRVVWEMTYRMTTSAGGAGKNRVFDGTVRLPAGRYVLRWQSDGSHAFGDWNDDPPDDPEGWGIAVLRVQAERDR